MFCYVIVFLPSHGSECTTICIKDAQQLGWPLPSSSSSLWALVAFQLITSIHLVQCFWPGQQRNAHNVHLMPDSWKNSWLPSRPGPADSGKFTRDTTVQVFKGVCWRDEWLVEAIGKIGNDSLRESGGCCNLECCPTISRWRHSIDCSEVNAFYSSIFMHIFCWLVFLSSFWSFCAYIGLCSGR